MTTEPENVFPAKYKEDVDLEEIENIFFKAFCLRVNTLYAAQAAIEIIDLGYVPIQWRHTFGDERADRLNEFLNTIKEDE